MSGATFAIGVDVGSSNVKVVAVGADGAVMARRRRPLVTDERPPVCEQDAEAIWDAVVECIAGCVAEAGAAAAGPVSGPPTVAIGVASQYSSTVPVRADGTPTGPVLMWRDRRGTDACRQLLGTPGAFELWVERHGIPPIGGGLSLGHVLHLIAEDPDGDTLLVEVMDYVTARLSGRVTATRHSMFTSQLCDNRSADAGATRSAGARGSDGGLGRAALRYDPELLDAAGVDPRRLPPLGTPDLPVGAVTPEVAARLGVGVESTVAPGINDTAAAALAVGADTPHRSAVVAGVALGTTSVLVTGMHHKAEDLDHELLAMPTPDGGYLVMAENGLGGRVPEAMLALLDRTGHLDADAGVAARFDEAAMALAATEPGAGGVLCLPWLAGSLAPSGSADARGGFIGMSLGTTRAELIRATFEGVAHNLAWLLRHVETFVGERLIEVRLTGGGADVVGWPQVIADVLDRPVRVVPDPAVAVARAAALRALGQVADGGVDPAAELVGQQLLQPNRTTRAVYDRHQDAFEATFRALRPVWGQLDGGL